jgi:peptidoglycan/xylan/chitin deacetylase (PgdA/CDA1 family)
MIDPLQLTLHACGASLCGLAAYGTFVPHSQLWGRVITRGPAGQPPAVALTFDDGPTDGPTDAVLDILGEAGAPAAFFVVGRNCRQSPRLLRRMHAEGHLVANHTHDHHHAGVFRAQWYWDRQLRDADAAIADVIGLRPALFRPPMGIKQFHTMRAARKRGQTVVGWTLRARDGVATTAADILARLRLAAAGDILLLHDGIEPNAPRRDPRPTIEALPAVLAALRGNGLAVRRLDAFLGMEAYQRPYDSVRKGISNSPERAADA